MNRYYYCFWIRLLDVYPVNCIAWELVARSYKYVRCSPKLYRVWDRLFGAVFYLHCARIKTVTK